MHGIPTCAATAVQSSGKTRLRSDSSCLIPATYSRLGNTTVFGDTSPSEVASVAPKNLSSALHMNGLFTTVTPRSVACFIQARYMPTSCEIRSTITL